MSHEKSSDPCGRWYSAPTEYACAVVNFIENTSALFKLSNLIETLMLFSGKVVENLYMSYEMFSEKCGTNYCVPYLVRM